MLEDWPRLSRVNNPCGTFWRADRHRVFGGDDAASVHRISCWPLFGTGPSTAVEWRWCWACFGKGAAPGALAFWRCEAGAWGCGLQKAPYRPSGLLCPDRDHPTRLYLLWVLAMKKKKARQRKTSIKSLVRMADFGGMGASLELETQKIGGSENIFWEISPNNRGSFSNFDGRVLPVLQCIIKNIKNRVWFDSIMEGLNLSMNVYKHTLFSSSMGIKIKLHVQMIMRSHGHLYMCK